MGQHCGEAGAEWDLLKLDRSLLYRRSDQLTRSWHCLDFPKAVLPLTCCIRFACRAEAGCCLRRLVRKQRAALSACCIICDSFFSGEPSHTHSYVHTHMLLLMAFSVSHITWFFYFYFLSFMSKICVCWLGFESDCLMPAHSKINASAKIPHFEITRALWTHCVFVCC